jgi:protein-arginine kinase activator protein McsA
LLSSEKGHENRLQCPKCNEEKDVKSFFCNECYDYEKQLDQARNVLLDYYTSHSTRHIGYMLSYVGVLFIFLQFIMQLKPSETINAID